MNPMDEDAAPTITLKELERLGSLSPGDAVKMQYRSEELRQAAIRHEARGDRIGALLDRSKAVKLADDAAMVLDPALHTTGRVTTGPRPNSRVISRQIGKYPRNGAI